jgi:cation diffusion facilitator family transporter
MVASEPINREQLGKQAGIVILISNLILFGFKYAVGTLSNSISIRADAVNNLTDTISAILTIIGFHISAKPKDKKHPAGYGRMEYISGLAIAVMILLAGVLFVKSSIERFISPEPVIVSSIFIILIPAIAVVVKLGLAYYSHRLNKIVESATIKATLKDCLFDAAITALTLITIGVSQITSFPVDALIGLVISGVIIYNGFTSAKENIELLLGNPLASAIERQIRDEVAKYPEFSEIKEIITNDFGVNNRIVVVELSPNINQQDSAIRKSADELSTTFDVMFEFKTVVYWRK